MAVTITDTRTVPSNGGNNAQCDATAGWTATDGPTLYTAAPAGVEATGCLGMQVSNTTQNAYFTMGTAQNWSAGMLIYAWVFSRGEPDTTVNGGIAIQLGDGTNRIAFHVAGSDKAGFRHSDGPSSWQNLVIDTSNLPTDVTVLAGSLASLNLAAITQVGVMFKTIAKSVGGTENMFFDIIRYGLNGLTITGGTGGDPGTFEQIASGDRSISDGAAHGMVRKLAANTYGVQGPLTFGDDAGSSAHVFRDNNANVIFEDRGLSRDKYWIKIVGNATGAGEFSLGTKTGTGDASNGIDGCNLIAPDAAPAYIDASDADLDEFNMYGCTISGFTGGIFLSNDATNGVNHEFHGNTVKNCGRVDLGRVVSRNNLFTGTAAFNTTADAAIADDGGAFTDETADFASATTADVLIFPATPVAADAFYFGHIAKFTEIRVLVSTASTTGTIVWEYYNGATWSTLTLTSQHTNFSRVGLRVFTFAVPGSWATTTINSQGPFFYVRARLSVAGTTVVASQGSLFGPADSAALLWNANININNCAFTQNTDADNDPHAVEHPANGSFTYTNLTFSGNDYDIEYSEDGGSSDANITAVGTSNPTTFEVTGTTTGTVNITNDKSVTLTGLKNPTEVRVYLTGTRTVVDGQEDVTTGSFNFTIGSGVGVDIRIFAIGYYPADLINYSTTSDATIPISQVLDRADFNN